MTRSGILTLLSHACCKAYLAIYRKIFVTKDVRDIWRYIVRYILRYRQILGAENIRDILRYYLAIKDKPKYLTSMPHPDNIGKPCKNPHWMLICAHDSASRGSYLRLTSYVVVSSDSSHLALDWFCFVPGEVFLRMWVGESCRSHKQRLIRPLRLHTKVSTLFYRRIRE